MKKKITLLAILVTLSFHIKSYAQTYKELVSKAIDFTDKKDYKNAEIAYKSALRKEPGNPANSMLFVNLGTIQRNLKEYDPALLSYTIAIEHYPKVIFLRYSRASLYCEMSRFDDALKDYNVILLYKPKDVDALYQRGMLYLYMKKISQAEADFTQIVNLKLENNISGEIGLGLVYKSRGEWKKALDLYSDLIYTHRTNAELYFNRAECYMSLKQLAHTQEDLDKAVKYGYNYYTLYILRGQLRLAQFDKSMAKEDFRRAGLLGCDSLEVAQLLELCK